MTDVVSGQAAQAAPDPVAMISALLDAEKVTPEKPVKESPAAEAQPETEAPAPENNAQVEGSDADTDEGEKQPVAEIPLDQLEAIELEISVQGEKRKVPIKALREGYMRQEDYSKKTAELARQRDEVGSNVRQAIEGERTQYLQNLQQLQALVNVSVAPELRDVNWNHLATNDPLEYVRLRNRAEQIQNAQAAIKTKIEEVSVKQRAEQAETLRKIAQQSRAQLEQDIPDFNDTLYQNLIKSSESFGYKSEEVAQWVDPRAIKVLHKAYLYDQLKAGKAPAEKRVVTAPVVVKPGASQPVSKVAQKQVKAMDQLRKSGRIDDLASVIASMG